MKLKYIIPAFLLIGFSTQANAQQYFFHMQGEVGNREAYFASPYAQARTAPENFSGPTEIMQLEVRVVYENASKPEWAFLNLQFECPARSHSDRSRPSSVANSNEPVKMRIGSGSYYAPRIDLKPVPTPETEWRTVATPIMLKARRLACYDEEMRKALRDSLNGEAQTFSQTSFNQKIRAYGFNQPMSLTPSDVMSGILELTWDTLWTETTRPDPSGLWSTRATPEQIEAARAQNAAATQVLSGHLARVEANIKRMDAEDEFKTRAHRMRASRSMSQHERTLISVWEAKEENDVAAAMGRPNITESGSFRYLSYGQSFDNSTTLQNLATGEIRTEGIANSCDVQFVLMADTEGTFRVADVLLNVEANSIGARQGACDGLLRVPN